MCPRLWVQKGPLVSRLDREGAQEEEKGGEMRLRAGSGEWSRPDREGWRAVDREASPGGEEISGGSSGGGQRPGWGWLGECRGGEGCW